MDVTAVGSLVPTVGGTGLLLTVIGFLGRLLWQSEKRHAAYIERLNTDHDSDMAELRGEVAELRRRVDELNSKLDAERERRWAAEEQLHRRAGGAP